MAKIFSTEKLSLNGSSIRIKSDQVGAFEITDANDNLLISRSTIEGDISSLHIQDSDDKDAVNADIASLATLESTNVSTLDSKVASLNTQDSDDKDAVNADIASLATLVSTNDVYADNVNTPSGVASIEIDYSSAGFSSAPAVMGTLRSSDSSDPVIAIQISGAPTTGAATFVFADDIPNGNYTIDVLASI